MMARPAAKLKTKSSSPARRSKSRRGTDPKRVAEIIQRLDATYPHAVCALVHKNAWQLLVATILSAQCTDVRVNLVTPELFKKYPTVQDFAAAPQEELQQDIRSTGFFRNKAKAIIGSARKIAAGFGGRVPEKMDELLTLPGVARKTANVVLGTAFGQATGIVVDTHVQRISRRLDLTRETHPEKIERDLMRIIPQNKWIEFSHQVIWHGRKLCLARQPRCSECPLDDICYAADKASGFRPQAAGSRRKPFDAKA